MNTPVPTKPSNPPRLSPTLLGSLCCICSALSYTAANICLRRLADDVPPFWVITVKELVTVGIVGPFLLWTLVRGRLVMPRPSVLAVLVATGLGVQLAGNLGIQWAFGVVGLAVSTPTAMGVMLVASALLGQFLLGERVPVRSILAIAVLIGAVVLLGIGIAPGPDQQTTDAAAGLGLGQSLLAIGAAALAGVMFATLAAAVRYAANKETSISVIVFVITGMGVLSCGSITLARIGTAGIAATPPNHLAWMLASGIFNLLAFLLITKGLQLTTLVHANVINASQVALAAIAGIVLFSEPSNAWHIVGVVLTLVGIFQINHSDAEEDLMEPV